jgi:glutathione-regulated potassium-efflux system ancillary protein KefG
MRYLPPFVTHGTHMLTGDQIQKAAEDYVRVIEGLRDGSFSEDDLAKQEYINDLIS